MSLDITNTKLVSDINEQVSTLQENVSSGANKAGIVIHDTMRHGAGIVENARGDILYSIRDLKHEGLTFLDSTLDNLALVVDRGISNITDTLQLGTLISMGGFIVFLILYGDQMFSHGFRLGKINLF